MRPIFRIKRHPSVWLDNLIHCGSGNRCLGIALELGKSIKNAGKCSSGFYGAKARREVNHLNPPSYNHRLHPYTPGEAASFFDVAVKAPPRKLLDGSCAQDSSAVGQWCAGHLQ